MVSNAGSIVGNFRVSFAVCRVKRIDLRDAHDLVVDRVEQVNRNLWSLTLDGVQRVGSPNERRVMSKRLAGAEVRVLRCCPIDCSNNSPPPHP